MTYDWTDVVRTTATSLGIVGAAFGWLWKILQRRIDRQERRVDELYNKLDTTEHRVTVAEVGIQQHRSECETRHVPIGKAIDGIFEKLDVIVPLLHRIAGKVGLNGHRPE